MFRSNTFSTFFALGVALLFLGVFPLWTLVDKIQANVVDTEALVLELQNLQQKKDDLVKIYNSVSEENIRKLEAVIPTASGSFDSSYLYLFLEDTAQKNGLRIENLTVAATDTTDKTKQSSAPARSVPSFTLPEGETAGIAGGAQSRTASKSIVRETRVTLSAIGSYESFKAFLQSIESNLRVIDIVSYKLVPRDPNAPNRDFSINVVLKTYYQ